MSRGWNQGFAPVHRMGMLSRSCLNQVGPFQIVRLYSRRSPSSSRWLNRASKDTYTREAQSQSLKSRAAFKLIQIDDKYKVLKKYQNVVDLGFAPGAWSQVAKARVKEGTVLGVDILPCQPPAGVSSLQANILSKQTHEQIRLHFSDTDQDFEQSPNVDTIISDMCAPFLQETGFWNATTNLPYFRMANTTGLAFKDHIMSMVSCSRV